MTDAAYAVQVAEVEQKREVVREYWRNTYGKGASDPYEMSIISAFPLPEKPRKLREVKAFGEKYRRREDGVLEQTMGVGRWHPTLYAVEHYAAVASLRDNPYEEEAP